MQSNANPDSPIPAKTQTFWIHQGGFMRFGLSAYHVFCCLHRLLCYVDIVLTDCLFGDDGDVPNLSDGESKTL